MKEPHPMNVGEAVMFGLALAWVMWMLYAIVTMP